MLNLKGISNPVSYVQYKHDAQASELVLRRLTRWRFELVSVLKCPLTRFVSALLLVIATATVAVGEDKQDEKKEKLPPALKSYLGRSVAQTMHYAGAPWLVRESRQREEDCATLLKELRLKPGMIVCDMGCGNGFYTLKMAKQVAPKGEVLAVDIQQEMLRLLEERAKKERIKGVKPVLGTLIDPQLPKGKVDLILCVDVYHEFSHPVHMLAKMRESLAPGGQIALAEFRLEDPKVPIKLLHKMSKKQILKEFNANGLKLVRQFDKLPWQHLMFFERDEKWKGAEE